MESSNIQNVSIKNSSGQEDIACIRIWWKEPLITTGACVGSGILTWLIVKLGWTSSGYGIAAALLFGCICFALLLCMGIIWCAPTGYNPHSINPHHCSRHDFEFDRHRGLLCCSYCEQEWEHGKDHERRCKRHITNFLSFRGGCPKCALAWQKVPKH
jgi:hypothetical protein